ncbi:MULTISPECIES: glycosyltransferase family 25 protein [unclassified Moritella]|uniref:glycosyltransferase family 25 protein n=1 Tax=unclassified Moritella TaxID=2637987 RepID=UPI001BA99672|nr:MULTISPECIES: glycosyltransferase family 25 protein [unclassified Moritella]QUM86925.1 glycosyltransferase family 25 protein [Moritella sp. 28]QUM91147.1 glycosyltransferase family 25 protein [Moritella sp. 36]
MNNEIFVINLDKSTSRLETSAQQLKAAGLSFTRIPAVYGADLSKTEKHTHYSSDLNHKLFYRKLNDGEIGAYLSHRKAWQAIVDKELDYGIVFEDDFILRDDLNKAIENINAIPFEWDYIKLASYNSKEIKQKVIYQKRLIDMDLVAYTKVVTGASATVISYKAAKELLVKTERFGRPFDTDLQYWWEKNIHIFCLLPFVSAQDENMLSDIDSTGGKRNKSNNRFFQRQFIQIKKFFLNRHHNVAFLAKYNNPDL